jgi:deoxyadenosine/deoxycytidine kinase
MTEYKRIEICGGVASGKTTLCHLLAENGLHSEFERFSDNPFWTLFYQDPGFHAFETEVTFLLQHYSQIKTSVSAQSTVAFDYSLLQDRAYAGVNLNGGRLEAFEAVYWYVTEELPPPVLIIYLRCPPREELRRIQDRARNEEKSIEEAYLDALNRAIAHVIDEVRGRVSILEIDSAALNFANNPDIQARIASDILVAAGDD